MMRAYLKSHAGYTFIEALVSLLLLSFVLLGIYGALETGNTVSTNDAALVEMQQQARNAMARIVREVRASSAQAITINDADSDTLTFTTPAATNVKYYLSGTELVREFPSGTAVNLASGIAHLKFTVSGQMLTVNLRADKSQYGRTISYPMVEEVRLRNE